MRFALVVLVLAAGATRAQGPLQSTPAKCANRTNPLEGNAVAQAAGAKLFARECASCHGAAGEGLGKAPPLRRADVAQAPPGALFWVLKNGALRQGMPSFAHLPEAQRWQIITFLQSLRATP